MSAFLNGYRRYLWQLQIFYWRVHSGSTVQHRRADQGPHTGGLAKRWSHKELRLADREADLALIAALFSEGCDEVDREWAEGR